MYQNTTSFGGPVLNKIAASHRRDLSFYGSTTTRRSTRSRTASSTKFWLLSLLMLSLTWGQFVVSCCHQHFIIQKNLPAGASASGSALLAFQLQRPKRPQQPAETYYPNGGGAKNNRAQTTLRSKNNNNNIHQYYPYHHHSSSRVGWASRLTMTTSATTEQEVVDIAGNMAMVRDKIQAAMAKRDDSSLSSSSSSSNNNKVRLVAVSKTKPLSLLQRAYDEAECRAFGENYVQELVEKVPALAAATQNDDDDDDVYWHYIGNLQSNKVNMLLSPFLPSESTSNVNKLHCLVLETVDSIKLARKLNGTIERSLKAAAAAAEGSDDIDKNNDDPYKDKTKLKIFVQVNTSGEASKSGVAPASSGDDDNDDDDNTVLVDLCREIVQECPHLHLQGLMTIGAPGDVSAFDTLVDCRNVVQDKLGGDGVLLPLELSMGMSGDYELAIQKGSTNVRVGSSIFGARDYSNNKK